MYDRVTGVTEARRERADSSRDRAPLPTPSVSFRASSRKTEICDKETDEISASSDSDIAQIGRIDLSPIATINVGIHVLLFSLFVRRETKLTHFRTPRNSIFRAFGFISGIILLYLRHAARICEMSSISYMRKNGIL